MVQGDEATSSGLTRGWAAFEAASYIETLHSNVEGIVHFLSFHPETGDPINQHVRTEDAPRVAREFAGRQDVYVSLCAYRCSGGPLAGIRTLHVDLDYYKVPAWQSWAPADVLFTVQDILDGANIPPPNLAVGTGRGLQIIWTLAPVVLRAERKARAAMSALVRLLKPFGADPACTNLARVFRLPGALNSKSGRPARLLTCAPHQHDFDALCRAILGENKPVQKPARLKTHREQVAENRSLVHRRLADLQRLVFGRWRGKVPEGARNKVARIAIAHLVQSPGDPFENALAWCAKWTDGHASAEIRRSVSTALRNKEIKGGYRYKGLTIGQILGVTDEERERYQLSSIYAATDTPEVIKQRRRDRDAAAKRAKRRTAGAAPQAESASRLKPWEALGISRRTYYRRQQKQNTGGTISAPLHSVLGSRD